MKKTLAFFIFFISFFSLSSVVLADSVTVFPTEDTYITQSAPDTPQGDKWYARIGNIPGQRNCTLAYFSDFNLPPEAVLDQALLVMTISDVRNQAEVQLKVGPNQASPALKESTATWRDGPNPARGDDYVVLYTMTPSTNSIHGIEVTDLVSAWMFREIPNNGLYVCMNDSSTDTDFRVYTKELTPAFEDSPDNIRLELYYHTATLGEPPSIEDYFTFSLIEPDDVTLSDEPYRFTWENPEAPDPAREHLRIVVNKVNDDGSTTEIFTADQPATSTEYQRDEVLDSGRYEWYVQAYQIDDLVYTTATKNFRVDHGNLTPTPTQTEAVTVSITPSSTRHNVATETGRVTTSSASLRSGQVDGQTTTSKNSGLVERLLVALGVIFIVFLIIALIGAGVWYARKRRQKETA